MNPLSFLPRTGIFKLGCLSLCLLGLIPAPGAPPEPLLHAHSHNDYLRPRPLFDALDHGFCSVEADIYLVDGRLLVAHDRSKVQAQRTLETLYLDPLAERFHQNNGRIFPDGPEFTLLIDLKTDWAAIYPVLRSTLTNYTAMLTTYAAGATRSNAVSVILSGNRSREMFHGERVRFAALDGELADLDSTEPRALIPWISGYWYRTFKWRGIGDMPVEEMTRLKDIVVRAHQQGRTVRFWGAPDKPPFWRVAREAGVDLINTDDLAGLETFLRRQ
ncbi:MAG TPA: phosphatidylinositol-specific phospholipase C/glycerophosphodiester phosphodiesterase family protein [Verrucomicrobiae bacterium]